MEYIFYIHKHLHINDTHTSLYNIFYYTDMYSAVYIDKKLYNRHKILHKILGKYSNSLSRLHYYYEHKITIEHDYIQNMHMHYSVPIKINEINWIITPILGA